MADGKNDETKQKTRAATIENQELSKASGGLLNNLKINSPVNVNNKLNVGKSNIKADVGPISFMSKLGSSVKKGIGKLK
jgi:hypothetical protein